MLKRVGVLNAKIKAVFCGRGKETCVGAENKEKLGGHFRPRRTVVLKGLRRVCRANCRVRQSEIKCRIPSNRASLNKQEKIASAPEKKKLGFSFKTERVTGGG